MATQSFVFVGCVMQAARRIATVWMEREREHLMALLKHEPLSRRKEEEIRVDYNYFKKWWKLCTLHGDHLKPRSVCRKSDMMYPSSQRHFSAPGPPRYDGGGDPSCTAPNLYTQFFFIAFFLFDIKSKLIFEIFTNIKCHLITRLIIRCEMLKINFFLLIIIMTTYKWPTSCAATIIPLKPPVSSMIATLLTFSSRLLTTQAPPT